MTRIRFLQHIIIFLTLIPWGAGCMAEGGGAAQTPASDDRIALTPPKGPFSLLVMSDVHVRIPGEVDNRTYDNQRNLDNLAQAISGINARHGDALLVAVTGDLVGALFSDRLEDYGGGRDTPADRFAGMMAGLAMPYYAALGNHDYLIDYDPVLQEGLPTADPAEVEAIWKRVLGIPPYYRLDVGPFQLLFLDSNRGGRRVEVCQGEEREAFCTGSFDDAQLDWLDAELSRGRPSLLFFHHPVFTDNPRTFWAYPGDSFLVARGDRFYEIASKHRDRIEAIFVGHGHVWAEDTLFETIRVFETAAIGDGMGAPSNLHKVTLDPSTGEVEVERAE